MYDGIALTEEEIKKLQGLKLNKDLSEVRDIFLIQCFCGCRVEDLPLLLSSEHIKEDDNGEIYSTFKTQKMGITSITPLNTLYPECWDIVERYIDNCPVVTRSDRQRYNQKLKELFKEGGLGREITYIGQRGKEKYTEVNKLYEVISSHCGRHTFITNCIRLKGLTPDKIKLITGHSDTKIIETVYSNLTKEDNKEVLRSAISMGLDRGVSNSSPVDFVKWLVKVLGIEVKNNSISLPQMIDMLAHKKREIIQKYGMGRYEQIKEFISIDLGNSDKRRLEVLFTKATGKKIRLLRH